MMHYIDLKKKKSNSKDFYIVTQDVFITDKNKKCFLGTKLAY